MAQREWNFDGLVGPTHNYAGLSPGNLASQANEANLSSPREAALQGLQKMRFVAGLGVGQAVLPPHPRPSLRTLRALGFVGTDEEVLARVATEDEFLLRLCSSAASMWTANAATVRALERHRATDGCTSPSANLQAMFHRVARGGHHRTRCSAPSSPTSGASPCTGRCPEAASSRTRARRTTSGSRWTVGRRCTSSPGAGAPGIR